MLDGPVHLPSVRYVRECMCVWCLVCVYIYVYIYIHKLIYAYKCLHTHTNVYIRIQMFIGGSAQASALQY